MLLNEQFNFFNFPLLEVSIVDNILSQQLNSSNSVHPVISKNFSMWQSSHLRYFRYSMLLKLISCMLMFLHLKLSSDRYFSNNSFISIRLNTRLLYQPIFLISKSKERYKTIWCNCNSLKHVYTIYFDMVSRK